MREESGISQQEEILEGKVPTDILIQKMMVTCRRRDEILMQHGL